MTALFTNQQARILDYTATFPSMANISSFMNVSPNMLQLALIQRQQMLLKYQAYQNMHMQARYFQNIPLKIETKSESYEQPKCEFKIEIKEERDLNTETSSNSENHMFLPISTPSNAQTLQEYKNQAPRNRWEGPYVEMSLREQLNYNSYLLKELQKMVKFIVANMDKENQAEIEAMRSQYLQNQSLLQIFDKLLMKYYSAKKCKEDIIRYILRKAFKVMKTSIAAEAKVSGKKASVLFFQKYFQTKLQEIEEEGINIENEDEVLNFLMPYGKNSKNKTMNTSFVMEVFSSKEFCQEYEKFLGGFHAIILDDNEKKVEKLVSFLADCVKKDNISKLGSYSRLPWLDVWIENTEKIAASLLPSKGLKSEFKRIKG